MKVNEDFSIRSRLEDVGRWYITEFVARAARTLPAGSQVLDAGAGECVYARYFSHCTYRAVDLAIGEPAWNYGNVDVVAFLDDLPFDDASFDAVLCTQVLEHLEWPRECVAELHRVLRPGGWLFLTAPMAHNEHQEPHDFFRYTSFGLKSICTHAGFREVTVTPLGGMFARWAYELRRFETLFPGTNLTRGKPSLKGLALLPLRAMCGAVLPLIQLCLLGLDQFDRAPNDPLGWSVTARK